MDNMMTNVLQAIDRERRYPRIPTGYRFHPNDVEILDNYLLPRLKGEKLPSDCIIDIDVYEYDPQQLPIDQFKYARENEAFFFTREQRRNSLGDDSIRLTPGGYWKAYEENILIYRANEIIGSKNKLFFYTGNNPNGNKTDWKMVEYKYDANLILASGVKIMEIERYTVCRIRLKDRTKKEEEERLIEELLKEESCSSEEEECLVENLPKEESGFNEENSRLN